MWIADTSIRRPVTTLTLMGALVVFGVLAFLEIGIDLFPEVDFPFVTVSTVLPGASPEVVNQDITDVLEERIKTIAGIESLTSRSFEGFSSIAIEFELEKDVNVAAAEVRAKVNLAKMDLPLDAEEPIVDKVDLAAQPILSIAATSSGPYRQLARYAEEVVKETLQSASGVGNVQLAGLRDREIRIWLDPTALEAHGLTAMDIVGAVRSRHLEMPGGRIESPGTEYTLRVVGEFASAEAMKELVVAERGGVVTRLRDVAVVEDGAEDRRSVARFNGLPAVGLEVRKQSGTNTVAVARSVKETLDELSRTAPPGITLQIASDSSSFIEESMHGVEVDIALGIMLTVIIMYLFLRNVRITFISVVTIPISLIGAFIAMRALDFTVNNLTMMALSLGVGLVIDDAIVVLENIFRHVEEGKPGREAASVGTSEVGLAVIAATSSIAAVFIPVAFMKGLVGRFFYQFGLTVAVTVLLSALISLTLTPFLCSRLLRRETSHSAFYRVLERLFTGLERGYSALLGWAVVHRFVVIVLAVATFAGGMALLPLVGGEFATEADESRYLVRLERPAGTSIDATDETLRAVERLLMAEPETKDVYASIGTSIGSEVNRALAVVNLVPKRERLASQHEIMARIRDKLASFEDIVTSVEIVGGMGGGQRQADLELAVQGPDVKSLAVVHDRLLADLRSRGIFVDLDTDLRLTKPEVEVTVNRNLAGDLGVDVRSLSNEVYALFGGLDVAKLKEGGQRYDIRLRALPGFRARPSDLDRLVVRSSDGGLVRASSLLSYRLDRGPSSINRYDRRRAFTVFSNSQGVSDNEAMEVLEAVARSHIPQDGTWGVVRTGMAKIAAETFFYMFQTLLIAILVIYMVLAIQFESFVHPFTIMVSLPFTSVGVLGALLLTGNTLNILSLIGVVMLMGLVTKNSILLVDFANQFRRQGLHKVEAMLRAGPLRLRPILMTAASTIFGVVPVALALSEGGETRAPMAIAVIGGMVTSTLLTLVVIPVVYLVVDDIVERIGGWFGIGAAARMEGASK